MIVLSVPSLPFVCLGSQPAAIAAVWPVPPFGCRPPSARAILASRRRVNIHTLNAGQTAAVKMAARPAGLAAAVADTVCASVPAMLNTAGVVEKLILEDPK